MSEAETEEEEVEEVFTLVYASAATEEFETEELEQILATARRNNAAAGVTGMLLYDDGSFLQALEGDREIVEALFERIEEDPRHDDTTILFRGDAPRSFHRWSMGFFRSSQDERPPGLNDFLRKGAFRSEGDDGETARKLLLGFREGRWRRRVET